MMIIKLSAPRHMWFYEMHIAGMVGQTIEVDDKAYKVVYARPMEDDSRGIMNRAIGMELGLELSLE